MCAKETITIREFEYLVPKKVPRQDCHELSEEQFAKIRSFVLANNEGSAPLELMHLCSRPGIGEAIQACNYVGIIELNDGTQIEILPKIGFDTYEKDRQVFLRMLSYLGSDVSFRALDAAHVSSKHTTLFEIFVGMFLAETSDLVRSGLRSAYTSVKSEESFVRGKIDFTRESRSNPAHAERLNLIHDEFGLDRPENRLIKSTLLYLRRASRSTGNTRIATRLLSAFDEASESHNVDADLAHCSNDRTTKRYDMLIAWCRVFLKHQSFTMFRGNSIATALLFPMEKVFEDYVGKMLRRLNAGRIARIDLQANTELLFEGNNVRLRPDILCELHGGRHVVLDTKWKRASSTRDISTADLHQMYAYGRRYCEGDEARHVLLLYPWHEKAPTKGLAQTWHHYSKDNVQVDVFFVDLVDKNTNLKELLELVAKMA